MKTQQGRSSDKTGLCSRKTSPDGALEHNQSYQDASPSIHFFRIATVLASLFRALCLRLSLAYGSCLMAEVRRCSCYAAAFLLTLKSNFVWSRQFSLTAIEPPIGHIPGAQNK